MIRCRTRHLFACWLIGLTVCAAPPPAAAGQWRAPLSVEPVCWGVPLEERVIAEGTRGRFQSLSLYEAALVASGVDDATELAEARRRINGLVTDLRSRIAEATPRQAAEAVFETLHTKLLSGQYRPQCTSLRETFRRGDYNCVSSTILYCSLARACGLKVEAVTLPDHVFCRATTDNDTVEIQTTCPTWFHGRVTARPAPRQRQRMLSDPGLVALIYYNQGVERLEADDYAAALEANRKATLLDPQSAPARANLRASYNNWVVDLASSRRYEQALTLLEEARRVAPDHAPFRANELAIYQQWTANYVADGQLRAALDVLDRGLESLPNDPILSTARRRLYRRILASEGAARQLSAGASDSGVR